MAASAASLRDEAPPPALGWTGTGAAVPRDPQPAPAADAAAEAVELVRTYAADHRRAWPFLALMAGGLTAAATLWVDLAKILPGALMVAAAIAVQGVLCRSLERRGLEGTSARSWRNAFTLAELCKGMGWVLFALPLLVEGPGAAPGGRSGAFVLVLVLLLSASTAILRSAILPAVWAGLAPLLLILAVAAAQGSRAEDHALALVGLTGEIFFVAVARRLHGAAAAEARTHAQIRQGLAELRQIRSSTDAIRRQAEEANRSKAQFFATMSHELRTPLNAILGFSELMKNEVLGAHSTPSYREYSSDIHGSGQHLLALINEILDLSRLEAGQYRLNESETRLGELVRDAVAAMAPRAEARSHTIVTETAPDLEPILADPSAVRQILSHLISNAVKFTSPGGQIVVRAGWTSRGGQYVSVRDDGPGIPAEEIPLALSSFGRGSHAVSSAEQGVGLGLPIAKGLAELHGGRLTLAAAPGRGTEATVIFPASRCGASRAAPKAAASAA